MIIIIIIIIVTLKSVMYLHVLPNTGCGCTIW